LIGFNLKFRDALECRARQNIFRIYSKFLNAGYSVILTSGETTGISVYTSAHEGGKQTNKDSINIFFHTIPTIPVKQDMTMAGA
jgi:hypothetical protein